MARLFPHVSRCSMDTAICPVDDPGDHPLVVQSALLCRTIAAQAEVKFWSFSMSSSVSEGRSTLSVSLLSLAVSAHPWPCGSGRAGFCRLGEVLFLGREWMTPTA